MLIICPLCHTQISIGNIVPLTDAGKVVHIKCDNCQENFSLKANKRFLDLKIKRKLMMETESIETIIAEELPDIPKTPDLRLEPIADTKAQVSDIGKRFLKALGLSRDA